MARRGTRMGRQPLGFRGRGEDKFSSTTLATLPSGVTLDKAGGTFAKGITTGSGCTLKKIDFGQGVQYRVYRGETGVSGAGGPDTRLSGGSIEIDTGLTTISSFAFGWQFQSGVTVGATKRATYAWNNAGFHHSSGNTVMIFLVNNSGGAVTPGCSAGYTGVSVLVDRGRSLIMPYSFSTVTTTKLITSHPTHLHGYSIINNSANGVTICICNSSSSIAWASLNASGGTILYGTEAFLPSDSPRHVNFPDGGVRMTSGLLIGLQRTAGCTLTAYWG